MGSQKSPIRSICLFAVFIVFSTGCIVYMYYYNTQWFDFNSNYLQLFAASNEKVKHPSPWKHLKSKSGTETPMKSQHWQQVGTSKKLYVFSAYHLEQENIVQVIGIAPVKTKVNCKCVLGGTDSTQRITVNGAIELLPEHHNKRYGAVYIRCPLRNVVKPSSVGIMFEKHTTPLRIIYPRQRRYNFTVCISSLHGPYSDPFRIIEMVETDMLFGADYFIVYNYSTTSVVDQVLRHYVRLQKMEVIQWNLPQIDILYWGQLASLQDCTYASRRQSKYLVLKDVDELIVPHKHKTWYELMNELDKGNAEVGSYLFRNTFFNLKWGTDNRTFKGAAAAKMYNITNLLYVWRENYFYPPTRRSKVIAHPERVITSGVHAPWKLMKGYTNQVVNTTTAYMHHYRYWTETDRPRMEDDFMRQFAEELLGNVHQTLSELEMGVLSWLTRKTAN